MKLVTVAAERMLAPLSARGTFFCLRADQISDRKYAGFDRSGPLGDVKVAVPTP